MRNYLAVWSWKLPDGRRQEITMTFWAHDEPAARGIAHRWFDRVAPTLAADFSLTDLSAEKERPVTTATKPAPVGKMTREERRARNRAYHGYIRNALEPTSAAIYDDMTVADLKAAARRWADDAWTDYLE